jgi:CheY-like chemotaxis protein
VFLDILSLLVATATLASEALSVIGEKKNEINIVLVEAQLPDMEVYELIDKMKSSSIPSFSKFFGLLFSLSLICHT